jgi:Type II secretion system (T2SS), protein N
MRARWLVAAGVGAFAVSLLWRTPAALAYQWLGARFEQTVRLYDVRGRALDGEAKGLLFGALPVRRVAWRWRPGGLVLGRLTLDTRIENPDYQLRGRVGLAPGGRLAITELDGGVPLSLVARQFAGTDSPMEATLDPEHMDLRWRQGQLTELEGPVYVRGLRMQGQAVPQVGDVVITFPGGEPPWRGEVQDEGGPLRIAGELTLAPDGAYTIDVRTSARNPSPETSALLAYLGAPDADGNYRLTLSGAL